MREYEVEVDGNQTTVQLSDEEAEARGLKGKSKKTPAKKAGDEEDEPAEAETNQARAPAAKQAAAPANKARTTAADRRAAVTEKAWQRKKPTGGSTR